MPKVISYARWSSPEQGTGDSLRRQMEAARAYAIATGHELDEQLRDEGVSAFRGKHATEGVLARLVDRVKAGEVEEGSVLVIEHLDRYSRAEPIDAIYHFRQLTRLGLKVYTTADGKLYDEDSLNGREMGPILQSLMHFIVGHQESVKKSDRSSANWTAKKARARAEGVPLTKKGPSWLEWDDKAKEWRELPEKVAIVRRIFDMADRGMGTPAIARTLNAEGVPPFGKPWKEGNAPQWFPVVVSQLLRSKAAIGTYEPASIEYRDGKRKRTKDKAGECPGYWPAIIGPDVFASVEAARMHSRPSLRGRHATGELRNPFGGLLRCAHCGGACYRDSKGTRRAGTAPIIYLRCQKAKTGAGCAAPAMRYEEVEAEFIANAPAAIEHARPGDAEGVLATNLATERSIIDGLASQMESIRAELRRAPSPNLRRELVEMARERDDAERYYRDLLDLAEVTAGRLVSQRLAELLEAVNAPELEPARVNMLLRQLVERATLDTVAGVLRLKWKVGGAAEVSVRRTPDSATAKRRKRAPRATAGAA